MRPVVKTGRPEHVLPPAWLSDACWEGGVCVGSAVGEIGADGQDYTGLKYSADSEVERARKAQRERIKERNERNHIVSLSKLKISKKSAKESVNLHFTIKYPYTNHLNRFS